MVVIPRGDSWDDPSGVSDCDSGTGTSVPVVPVVAVVPVSPSLVVREFCDAFSLCYDWEFVEPQFFSFCAHSRTFTKEEIRFEGSQAKAPPLSRRRMMPPTPLRNSYSSFEQKHGHFEVEDQTRSARDRTVIARTKQYLEESKSLKVEIEEWDPC